MKENPTELLDLKLPSLNQLPEVSVVIPVYNQQNFVEEAIHSVLAQTNVNLEIIVIDDGSTDQSPAILAALRYPELIVKRQQNAGVSCARNLGISLARGRHLAFLDADDLWTPHKLRTQLEFLERHPDVGLVGSWMEYVSATGVKLGSTRHDRSRVSTEEVRSGRLMPFPLSSFLVRRQLVDRVGYFDPDMDSAEDFDFLVRVSEVAEIAVIDQTLGQYRVHGGSISMEQFVHQRVRARFIRQRQERRATGSDLDWTLFHSSHLPSTREKLLDRAAFFYRTAGIAVAERQWARALLYGAATTALAPRRTLTRLRGQLI